MLIQRLNNERGMAMAVVLGILLMLGLIGVAAIRTAVTDMDISKSMTDRTRSFYAAEAGLELMLSRMASNPTIVARDSVLDLVDGDTLVGNGSYHIDMTNGYPVRTVMSVGHDLDGVGAVAVDVYHRRNPVNPWDNAIFAGVGQTGHAISGNVDIHGSVHILGDGEDFTDANGNDRWDDADQYTDVNGDGIWEPGEPLTTDTDGDGVWDPAEPYVDDNGNGSYDETLTATDLSFEASGTAAVRNNYDGMNATLSSRMPGLSTVPFNGENVQTLDAEMRVKHGRVNLSGTATVGQTDVSGGSPAVKETLDGVYVNDGYGGTSGAGNVYSDNGTAQLYDLGDDIPFPSLNDPIDAYPDFRSYLAANALVISGDVTLQPGVTYTSPYSANGSLSVDASGNVSISGIVLVTGNVTISAGAGPLKNTPLVYDGRGTIVSGGNMYINTHVISRDQFPTNDVMGFLSYHDMEIGTGPGASQLNLMGAFYAQQAITNQKQNSLAGAMVSNYFNVFNVPSIYQVPSLVDNLPPGMPGGNTIWIKVWRRLASTWREM
jgi:hypothetical protein